MDIDQSSVSCRIKGTPSQFAGIVRRLNLNPEMYLVHDANKIKPNPDEPGTYLVYDTKAQIIIFDSGQNPRKFFGDQVPLATVISADAMEVTVTIIVTEKERQFYPNAERFKEISSVRHYGVDIVAFGLPDNITALWLYGVDPGWEVFEPLWRQIEAALEALNLFVDENDKEVKDRRKAGRPGDACNTWLEAIIFKGKVPSGKRETDGLFLLWWQLYQFEKPDQADIHVVDAWILYEKALDRIRKKQNF